MLFRIEGLIVQDNMELQLENLKYYTVEQLKSWCKRFYGSGNIIFVISGAHNESRRKSGSRRWCRGCLSGCGDGITARCGCCLLPSGLTVLMECRLENRLCGF